MVWPVGQVPWRMVRFQFLPVKESRASVTSSTATLYLYLGHLIGLPGAAELFGSLDKVCTPVHRSINHSLA